jgi:hypothetical protein
VTPTLAALVLTNLLYLAGAVVVASLVSGLYVLRHRKPKSVESGIESFSRELRALAPERRADVDRKATAPPPEKAEPTARRSAGRRQVSGAVATATGQAARPEVGESAVPESEVARGETPEPEIVESERARPEVAESPGSEVVRPEASRPEVAGGLPPNAGIDGADPRSRSG